MTSPPIVAHRGLAARFPENTLVGVSAALSAGARFLEVDLQLSADGVAFVHHDWETSRTCGVEGSIGDRSEEELCQLSASYVERFGADAVLDAVLPYAESLGARAVLLSFSIEVLRRAKERSPLERGVACESYKELMGATVSELDPRHVFCDVKSLPSSGDLSIEGRTLTVWEVINPELARALLDRGVDLIESFSCDTLIPALTRDKE